MKKQNFVRIKNIKRLIKKESMIDITIEDNENFILSNGICVSNSAMIDLNVMRLADTIIFKEPSLLQSRFERKALVDLFKKADENFNKIPKKDNKKKYFYVLDDEFEGLLSSTLPSFWSDKISKSFAKY
ncbi:MAG: hypothetical protein ABIE22_01040 [archaeon]